MEKAENKENNMTKPRKHPLSSMRPGFKKEFFFNSEKKIS